MFDINKSNLYTWHRLFLVLSLESITPFFEDASFPIREQIGAIHDIGRTFVQKFYDIEHSLFLGGEVSNSANELFSSTYSNLVGLVGVASANKFCAWGNRLFLDTPFEKALLMIWEEVLPKLVDTDNVNSLPIQDISQRHLIMMNAVITKYGLELRGIYGGIDLLESLPKDSWESEVYRIYNQGDRRNLSTIQIDLSPLDYFAAVVTYLKIQKALCSIKALLTASEFLSLTTWIALQPNYKSKLSPKDVFDSCE